MSSMKFPLKSLPQHLLLTGNSMEYRQVPILIHLPFSVYWLNEIVLSLILLLRNSLPVRKNKTSSSLIFTFCSFSTPDFMLIWTPLQPRFQSRLKYWSNYIWYLALFAFLPIRYISLPLKFFWSILEVSLLADTIKSFIISSLKSFKFWRTFNSLKIESLTLWKLINFFWLVGNDKVTSCLFNDITLIIELYIHLVITNLKTFIEVL